MSTERSKRKPITYVESSDDEPEPKKQKVKPVKRFENTIISKKIHN